MKKIYQLLIAVLILIALLTSSYFIGKNSGKKSVEYNTEIVYKYDTITKVIKEPYKVIKETTKYVELPQKIDTVVVIKEFYSKHYIAREFSDTNIIVTVKDTLYKNDILSGNMTYKWLQPTQVTTKTSVVNNYYSYLSIGLSTQPTFNSFSADIMLHTKKYYVFTGYDPLIKTVRIGVGTTLFKFK